MHSSARTVLPTADLQRFARKSKPDEVFVRTWREVSPQTHVVTLGWPPSHDFYTLRSGVTSPLFFVETVRQALAVLSHTSQEIPLDHRLGWEYAHYAFAPAALRERHAPTDVELRITHGDITRRRLGSVHLTARIDATCAGEPLGSSEIRYVTHPPAIYNRLRGEYADAQQAFATALPPAPPVPPSLVDRSAPGDVVIAPTARPHHYQLRTDTSNPVLFDHPHDHVPGMVLLEAAAQAVHASAPGHARPAAFDSTFLRYVEFDAPCWLDLTPKAPDGYGRSRLVVTGTQNGQEAFSTTVTLESTSVTVESASTLEATATTAVEPGGLARVDRAAVLDASPAQ
ncbi:ScbA/BarX family gamma-butyrolactone biosynthesis protein [Streptomyces capitiformicae]|uniref:Adhesin n=1 Tax=Streptomyces capitiformicae TaxID=2014920 RepID=A0A918ZK40_9ACTN|nr:ScbA/BarX family gamma-butyrolactone biosynthesis protein [Streptomyces capitiformicae]GHE57398.1 adhesin [Streptomyces capitiformicae]